MEKVGIGGAASFPYNHGLMTSGTVLVEDGPRRVGDAAELVAESGKIRKVLGWRPEHDDLKAICSTAFKWEVRLRAMPLDRGKQVVS